MNNYFFYKMLFCTFVYVHVAIFQLSTIEFFHSKVNTHLNYERIYRHKTRIS